MRRPVGAVMAALLASALWIGAARAESDQPPSSGESVSGQFKEGAHRIGEGAVHIGQGIKQGAIDVWDAAKAGASAAADKFRKSTGSAGGSTSSDAGAQH